jgi:hypothetical protein
MPPVGRVGALEAELARVQQEREAEADDLAAMLVRIAEAERAKGTAARAAVELGELVNALQVQLRGMQAQETSTVSEWATQLATTRQHLEEAQQRLTESQAMSEALRAWSGETERKLQSVRQELAQAEEEVRMAVSRASLAERSAADGAAMLELAHTAMEADRARVIDLEGELERATREHDAALEVERRDRSDALDAATWAHGAEIAALEARHQETLRERETQEEQATAGLREEHGRILATLRREHAAALEEHQRRLAAELAAQGKTHEGVVAGLLKKHDEALLALEQRHAHTLSAVREEHAATRRVAARAFEEERSAAARARQQVSTLEASLASTRGIVERATELLDELERREEMAAAIRTRTLEQARETLAGAACEPLAPDPPVVAPLPIADRDSGTLDEIEIDLVD